jgi:NitT/TauT family transport system ATP-binding protein
MSDALVFRNFGLAHRRPGGEEVLLDGVNLTLPRHGFFVFIGTSGGGKSSLLRILAGLIESREPAPRMTGELLAFGKVLTGDRPESLGNDVAAILQDEGLLDELSPRENVELALRAAGRSLKLAPALLAQAGRHSCCCVTSRPLVSIQKQHARSQDCCGMRTIRIRGAPRW